MSLEGLCGQELRCTVAWPRVQGVLGGELGILYKRPKHIPPPLPVELECERDPEGARGFGSASQTSVLGVSHSPLSNVLLLVYV